MSKKPAPSLAHLLLDRCFAAVTEPWRLTRPIGKEYEAPRPKKPRKKRQ